MEKNSIQFAVNLITLSYLIADLMVAKIQWIKMYSPLN